MIQAGLTEKWVSEPLWPWPLALAYSQPSEVRQAAVEACIKILEIYDPAGDGSEQFCGIVAVHRVYEAINGEDGLSPSLVELMSLEENLRRSIKEGRCKLLGRATPTADLEIITEQQMTGREVSPDRTCDLVTKGWAKHANSLSAILDEVQRTVAFYDLHLRRDEVQIEFRDRPDEPPLSVEKQREPPNGWIDHGRHDDDALILDDYMAEAGPPREGYWTIFSALAWVVSRDPTYVSAVQTYEGRQFANRGSVHSAAAWICLGDDAGERFGKTFTSASVDLREKLETGEISGIGTERSGDHCRLVQQHEWTQWAIRYEHDGIWFLPGIRNCQFLSQQVRSAFPATELEAKKDPTPEEWAMDAASRGIGIKGARADAVNVLGDKAPPHYTCKELIRQARNNIGNPVRLGRPIGRKSFAGQII